MEIINKRKNYEYDTEYNYVETLKLIELISIFLEQKNNITSKNLYNLIQYFYDIKIDINDYLDYINQEEGYDFDKIVDIPTNMVIMDMTSEGHGKNFSWWTQNYQIIIKAATKEFIPSKEEYAKEKIEKLIKEKNIYPLYSFGKETKKEVSKEKNNIKYLIPYLSKKLDDKDIYFNFMINRIYSKIGNDNLLKEIRIFIINLKLNSIEDEDRYYSDKDLENLKIYDDLSNKLIILYNSIDNECAIDKKPLNIVISYLKNLLNRENWFDEITPQQIIKVLKNIDYDTNKIICNQIEEIIILLKDPELCYEMAANIEWVNKDIMANIVLESKNPDYNYCFASEVENANIEKHVEVILNNNTSDEYILDRAKSLIKKNNKRKK